MSRRKTRISRVTTRQGDKGESRLDDGARYLNRLSDFFFVLARALNAGDELREDLWRGT